VCVDENGEHERNMRIEAPDGDADPWVVAETQYFSQRGMEAANARLIAAAPEMAEALQMWSDYHNGADDVSMMLRYAEALEATMTLLARIRGDAT
jgi:hypothetical protein